MNFNFNENTSLVVVINEQHTLLPQQEEIVKEYAGGMDNVEFVHVPAKGWSLEELEQVAVRLSNDVPVGADLLFVSPIPYLIRECSRTCAVILMHNDKREKKELPNGKIIFTVAREGWQIV